MDASDNCRGCGAHPGELHLVGCRVHAELLRETPRAPTPRVKYVATPKYATGRQIAHNLVARDAYEDAEIDAGYLCQLIHEHMVDGYVVIEKRFMS